jgi:endo-1,4-beta-D-glucanase Y
VATLVYLSARAFDFCRRALACGLLVALLLVCAAGAEAGPPTWTNLWQGFQSHYIDGQGRVIDPHDGGISTSEGQAYSLFFALVANDRRLFDRILRWTQNNLARGSLSAHLPVWRWGRAGDGQWGPLSSESASDADLWLAYTLLSAARLWHDPHYADIAQALLRQIERHEIVRLSGWGPVLLPGDGPYWREDGRLIVNPSYSPPFLLAGLARADPQGPWSALYASLPRLLAVAAPRGFAPDWFVLEPGGFGVAPQGPDGGYNAIRCYLWTGMSANNAVTRALQHSLRGMAKLLDKGALIPEWVNTLDGKGTGHGPPGFAAALLPYLEQRGDGTAAKRVSIQLYSTWNSTENRFGPHYYDNALALFALGYVDELYRFSADGTLQVFWARP